MYLCGICEEEVREGIIEQVQSNFVLWIRTLSNSDFNTKVVGENRGSSYFNCVHRGICIATFGNKYPGAREEGIGMGRTVYKSKGTLHTLLIIFTKSFKSDPTHS